MVQTKKLVQSFRVSSATKKAEEARLDSNVEQLLIAINDIGRIQTRELRKLSPINNVTESGLSILSMVNAGLNRPACD